MLDHQATRAQGVILGLKGTRDREPEVALADLEEQARNDDDAELVAFIRAESGRSPSAIGRDIDADDIDGQRASRLLEACHNDEELYQRVKPFANLIRDDHLGDPVVIPAGSVYVTAGTARRATGTHYTPKSLTEPIVQHTLEPLVYIGPAEGRKRDKWKLKQPAELLDLKICDLAMGSGAFLVRVVRYMRERLVEAWNALSDDPRVVPNFTVEGAPPTGRAADILIPVEPEERSVLARRLIAGRCVYGVDKNPLAVEMAKLSLWLITLKKDTAFSFLDHALKCGDSLVGVDVSRLGIMVVANQPNHTAEYILATSRIGRQYPGLVLTVYNWARPRDVSHYERFKHYHETFYQQVEALSVTPFASRALDRGLSAVLVSHVRLANEDFSENDKAGEILKAESNFAAASEAIRQRVSAIHDGALSQVEQMMRDRIDLWTREASNPAAHLGYAMRYDGKTVPLLKHTTGRYWEAFTCLNSLRDVEPPVSLIHADHSMEERVTDMAAPDAGSPSSIYQLSTAGSTANPSGSIE